MDCYFLNRKGYSLIEVCISLGIMGLFLLIILPTGAQIIASTRSQQNYNNLFAIGQACQEYYLGYGQWPLQAGSLQPFYLNQSFDTSNFVFNPQLNILIVSSGTNSFTVLKPTGLAGRLDYTN